MGKPGFGVVGGIGRTERKRREMMENRGLLSDGWGMVARNKRYILWFYVLNLTLAEFGVAAFRNQAHAVLDHSMLSDKVVHGFDVSVLVEMLSRPEFGPTTAATFPAMYFGLLFLAMTVLFLPGVFQGYASTYRLPKEDFFRACGRNLWRFVRLMIIAGIVMGIVAGGLFTLQGLLVKKAGDSTNELLPFTLKMLCLLVIFLVMTVLRIWFDLAEADVVLNDQGAVRKSIGAGFRHTFRELGRLVGSYVAITLVAAVVLCLGLLAWINLVAADNLLRAFVVTQLTLLLLLIPRFWQRGVAVSYWQQKMLVPVVVVEPVRIEPVPVVIEPMPSPIIPNIPPETQGA
jgi:hypothetical protein